MVVNVVLALIVVKKHTKEDGLKDKIFKLFSYTYTYTKQRSAREREREREEDHLATAIHDKNNIKTCIIYQHAHAE